MLSPGDKVFIHDENEPGQQWTIRAGVMGVDFSTGNPSPIYSMTRGHQARYFVGAKEITGHWVEG